MSYSETKIFFLNENFQELKEDDILPNRFIQVEKEGRKVLFFNIRFRPISYSFYENGELLVTFSPLHFDEMKKENWTFQRMVSFAQTLDISPGKKEVKPIFEKTYSVLIFFSFLFWLFPLFYFTTLTSDVYFGETKVWNNLSDIQIGDFIKMDIDVWTWMTIEEVKTNYGIETSRSDGNIYILATQPEKEETFLVRFRSNDPRFQEIINEINTQKGSKDFLVISRVEGEVKPLSMVETIENGSISESFKSDIVNYQQNEIDLVPFSFLIDANVVQKPASVYEGIKRNTFFIGVLWIFVIAGTFQLKRKRMSYIKDKMRNFMG